MKKTDQLNILEFCLSPDLGGLELFCINCFQHFKEKTDTFLIVAPNKKLDNHIPNEIKKSHLKRNKLLPIIPAMKLAKFIDKNEIDIIHFHWTKDIATVVIAKILSKKSPKIIQSRHMTMTRFKDDFYHKWLYKNISTIHAVTDQVKEQLKKFIPQEISPKIEMVYIGTKEKQIDQDTVISLNKQYKLLDTDFVVGIVGRIEEGKGQYLVIEAIEKLKDLNIKAVIVGDTMDQLYLDNLKNKIKDLEIEDKIIFTGFTKDVDAHMHLFDVNILATPKETFGLVLIEAMINKICVIATNNGGPLEIIDDQKNGLLFDRTSDDLSLKIKLLYENQAYKNKLAIEGYIKAKDIFDSETQFNKVFEVINES